MVNIYDTYVVKNSKEKSIPRQLAGGKVVAWSTGHMLDKLFDFNEFVELIACGDIDDAPKAAAEFLEKINIKHRTGDSSND